MLKLEWLDLLGDWNPQLLRELKGRLKPHNLILAGAISLLGQFLLLIAFLARVPQGILNNATDFSTSNAYCTGFSVYANKRKCLVDAVGNLVVDWQRWSLDLFLVLSLIGIFGLLVAGTYLLIDNLAQEERRGTLNFIRLSPRSPQNILWGKILGVPILLYVVALLALPLHLWAGFAAHIPVIRILSFYGVLATSCVFCYSLSLLFSLISAGGLKGFQAWLGSGAVFLFILLIVPGRPFFVAPLDWVEIFSPRVILSYLISGTKIKPSLYWFNLPVDTSIVSIASILISNYSLWTYWSWQAIQRRFLSPSKTIFSKLQSYLLVAYFEIVALGFAINSDFDRSYLEYGARYSLKENFIGLLAFNFVLFFGLIITLTPQRQAVTDWARYRQQKPRSRKGLLNLTLLRDLVWGEKSPVIVAIALNAAITAIILVPWIIFSTDNTDKLTVLIALVLSLSLIMVCAAIAQLVTFMQIQKLGLWIISILSTIVILPPLMLTLLSVAPSETPTLWLFTVFAIAATKNAGLSSIFLALLGQLTLFTLCSWQIARTLKKAGVSNSLPLFTSQPRIKPY